MRARPSDGGQNAAKFYLVVLSPRARQNERIHPFVFGLFRGSRGLSARGVGIVFHVQLCNLIFLFLRFGCGVEALLPAGDCVFARKLRTSARKVLRDADAVICKFEGSR